MRLDPVSPSDLRRAMGVELSSDGTASPEVIARLTRAAVQRWGVCAATEVTRYVRQQVDAIDGKVDVEQVASVRDRLLELGDLQRVRSDGRLLIARTPPRWVRVTESMAIFLGSAEVPDGLQLQATLTPSAPGTDEGDDAADPLGGLARRFLPTSGSEATLAAAGAASLSLDEWWMANERDEELGAGFVVYLERRGESGPADIARLWARLTRALEERGSGVAAPAEDVWTITGGPGGFFGRPPDTGRWSTATRDGTWCGRRRGPTEAAPRLPVIVHVEGGRPIRLLDLHDETELDWAVVARGVATGAEEHVDQDQATGRVQFRFPPPRAITRLMHLIGAQVGAWRWQVPASTPPVWRRFLGLEGGRSR